jgi:hypothetical protein
MPVRQNYRVNNFPADQAFPSPKLFMGTVKFVIGYGTPASRTFGQKQFIHDISFIPIDVITVIIKRRLLE